MESAKDCGKAVWVDNFDTFWYSLKKKTCYSCSKREKDGRESPRDEDYHLY
jgi:hypothetical protein